MPKKGQSARRGRTSKQHAVMEQSGWRRASDPALQARRQQRFRLRNKQVTLTQDDVDVLIRAFLKKNKVTQLPVGWALGAHRDGVDILVNG